MIDDLLWIPTWRYKSIIPGYVLFTWSVCLSNDIYRSNHLLAPVDICLLPCSIPTLIVVLHINGCKVYYIITMLWEVSKHLKQVTPELLYSWYRVYLIWLGRCNTDTCPLQSTIVWGGNEIHVWRINAIKRCWPMCARCHVFLLIPAVVYPQHGFCFTMFSANVMGSWTSLSMVSHASFSAGIHAEKGHSRT